MTKEIQDQATHIEEAEENTTTEALNVDDMGENELTILKRRADQMDIKYPKNAGLNKMRELVNQALDKKPEEVKQSEEEEVKTVQPTNDISRIRDEAFKLIRVRITVANPAKQTWAGEVFTAGNTLIGHIRRFVPFNSEDGIWHIEQIILEQMLQRKYTHFQDASDPRLRGTRDHYRPELRKEFSIEILPQLTEEELKVLALKQASEGTIGKD